MKVFKLRQPEGQREGAEGTREVQTRRSDICDSDVSDEDEQAQDRAMYE